MENLKINSKLRFFVVIIISCVLFSCKSSKDFSVYNYFNGTVLYNDTLNLSVKFPGDVRFKSDFNPKHLKKKTKKISPLKNASPLAFGKTVIPPYYQFMLFYEEFPKDNPKDKPQIKLLIEDSINQQVLYQSDIGNKSLYLLLKSTDPEYNSMVVEKNDGRDILETASFDISVKEELGYWDIFNQYFHEDNVLFLKEKIKKAPIEANQQSEWDKLQILLTLLSRDPTYPEFKKDIKQPDKNAYLKPILEETIQKSEGVYTSKKEVLEKIKELGESEQVVMLNENHWMPNHRILAAQLLDPLKEAGFHYLAVEAVYEGKDHYLNERKVPTHPTGYYTREPYFGLFLRKAKELGFEIISYDRFDTENRELEQAQNIYNTIKNDPEAKIFVYAGGAHVNEKKAKYDYKRMAAYFKEISNIDPITIDQTTLLGNTNDGVVLFDSQYFPDDEKIQKNTDYLLLNSITPGLTEFYPKNNLREIQLEIPELSDYKNKEVFISVFIADEFDKFRNHSVSIKNKIHQVKNETIRLTLPKQNLYISIKDEENRLISLEKIDY